MMYALQTVIYNLL